MQLNTALVYPGDGSSRIPFPGDLLKVAQNQHINNDNARVARLRDVMCPVLGSPNSRNDLVALFIENPLFADDDLADMLALEVTELMCVWEERPISLFDCLVPYCRASIPVRNRTHLLRLLRLDRYFGLMVGAGDPVEFKTLCEMLCDTCTQEQQHRLDEEHRMQLLAI